MLHHAGLNPAVVLIVSNSLHLQKIFIIMILVVPGYPVWVTGDKPRFNLLFLSLLTSGSSAHLGSSLFRLYPAPNISPPPPSYYSRY